MCSISSIICLYCLCLSVFSGGWKCHILLNVWGMHVISFVGVQKFGFTGWQSSKCLLYCWLFSWFILETSTSVFSRLKYNPVCSARPGEHNNPALIHQHYHLLADTHTHTHSCRWGRGWRHKDKTFSVYYEKRDGEQERGKRRESKIKDVRTDSRRETLRLQ